MDITVKDSQSDLSISKKEITPIVKEVLSLEGVEAQSLGVFFVSEDEISKIHDRFFSDPSPTDCISLPMDMALGDLGDAFICPKTALKFVAENGGCPWEECTLYLVHCLLHLVGYDDIGEQEPQMRIAEERSMRALTEKGLLLRQQ